MANNIKSGKEILDEFFEDITNIPNIDKKVAEEIKLLYIKGDLAEAKVIHKLQSLREEELNGKN